MRALVVSNMRPDGAHPERGSFVRDQVAALRRLGGLDVELYEFGPGVRALARAPFDLRRRFGRERGGRSVGARDRAGDGRRLGEGDGPRFDVVHAHFGLTAWPALAVPAGARAVTLHGTDVRHRATRQLTRGALPLMDLVATVSAGLAEEVPGRTARSRTQVLPCGVDIERFRPLAREQVRTRLGLRATRPYLLFGADPVRPGKGYEHALALSRATGVELLTLGGVEPADVPLWVNAANAVLVPSEREGFGLAVLEALACDVPVLATPVGIHGVALEHVPGTLSAPFELRRWCEALAPHLRAADPRVPGRASAARFSAVLMAERVAAAWCAMSGQSRRPSGRGSMDRPWTRLQP